MEKTKLWAAGNFDQMGHLRNFFLERLDRFSEKSSIDSTDIGKALERALKVNRIEVDEEVFVLDGKGRQIQAKCKAIRPFGFEIINFSQEKKSKPNLHLFLAPPQGPAFDEAIVQACEIGVDEITFIKSQHGQNFSERIWKKAENRILEACLQCGRSFFT